MKKILVTLIISLSFLVGCFVGSFSIGYIDKIEYNKLDEKFKNLKDENKALKDNSNVKKVEKLQKENEQLNSDNRKLEGIIEQGKY